MEKFYLPPGAIIVRFIVNAARLFATAIARNPSNFFTSSGLRNDGTRAAARA
jgi:hypothetical protein